MSDLFTAVVTAADYKGVSVVSMSLGTAEFAGETPLIRSSRLRRDTRG